MTLDEVKINNAVAMKQKIGKVEWLKEVEADHEAKQRMVESVLDALNDQVRVVPASRYLTKEALSSEFQALSSGNYKNWLHSKYLSRTGYDTFKRIRDWFLSESFNFGEISFVNDNNYLDLMIEDNCEYRMLINQKGSGIQQILVLLGYIAESNVAVVAIEEPELNLSFANQDNIVTILKSLIDDTNDSPYQLLLTSHSDHIGSRGDLERYHVEKLNDTETTVRHFTDDDRINLFPRN